MFRIALACCIAGAFALGCGKKDDRRRSAALSPRTNPLAAGRPLLLRRPGPRIRSTRARTPRVIQAAS